ncbi:unnamed protein product [Dovyalis caffra]|uniref:Uncharacterized protein n=1 Tax=Dovyalis caffra TaxID=77055 RepID=A0AAV1RJG9_9ROSI|nr:unnamed protein product [Dovyalis caffra]
MVTKNERRKRAFVQETGKAFDQEENYKEGLRPGRLAGYLPTRGLASLSTTGSG